VTIEYRWANGNSDKLPALASELVRRQPAVIASAGSLAAARAAKAATTSIPIVFEVAAEPVAAGLVKSLTEPNGNLTGVVALDGHLAAGPMIATKPPNLFVRAAHSRVATGLFPVWHRSKWHTHRPVRSC
jgi:hypothetical protein